LATRPDSTNWNLLLHLAHQRRDAAAKRLGVLLTQGKDAQQKLQMLLDYRLDYQGRLESAARMGIQGEGLRNFQSFLANLERAIEQQTDTMASLQEQIYEEQAEVAAEQRKIDSYQVLDERRISAENDRDRRRQQVLQDELGTRSRPKLVIGGGN